MTITNNDIAVETEEYYARIEARNKIATLRREIGECESYKDNWRSEDYGGYGGHAIDFFNAEIGRMAEELRRLEAFV